MHTNLDVLVIGAGQAALALGHQLRASSLRFQLLERHARIGESWRRRYDSLTLFTPRRYSALPGLALDGDPEGYPTKDEIADYLERYARHFELPIALGAGVRSLERNGAGFRAITDAGDVIHARSVVIATGAFQTPAIPAIARGLSPDVATLTPETYKNPSQVPSGSRVLVVGDGATGRQLAAELIPGREVVLATGHPRKVTPTKFLGRSMFWWMEKTGLLAASRDSAVGRRLRRADSFPSDSVRFDQLRALGISVVGRVVEMEGRRVRFASGERADVDVVIFATGYRDQSAWVAIADAKDEHANFVEHRGIAKVPGLFFIGRSWQWTRGSATLFGVGVDAAFIRAQIAAHLGAGEASSVAHSGFAASAARAT
jgi:putative flavoprotein involved in K+ transport